jgi:probable phosphoglycerate mutase
VTTTFHLVRHGQKSAPDNLLAARAPGVHLTALGQRQVEWTAERLQPVPLRHVFSSPLERTRETATVIARTKGLQVEVSESIIEVDFGSWTNKSFEDLAPEVHWKYFNTFRSGTRIPGGELMFEVQARFVGEMLRLRDRFPNEHVALVTHADPIKAAIAYFAGSPLDLWDRFEISPASITTIALSDYGAKILRLNDTPEI